MKVSEKLIRELAQLSETDRTVLSAYLDIGSGWDAVKHFIDKESPRLLSLLNNQEKDYFETSLSSLFNYLQKKKIENFHGPGLAFFADMGVDFTRGVELVMPPEPLLAIDDEAIIQPLALQLDEYEPIGVIMIDAHCTRILITAGQIIEGMDSFCERIHHLSKAGGWSQMRYQRRHEKEMKHFAKDVMQKALEIFDEVGVNRILIAGRDRMITAIEQESPKIWNDKVIGTVRWDLDAPDNEFLHKIKPILEEAERNQEKNLLGQLVGELRRHGLAVAGTEQTLKALNMGQVDTLLISRALDFRTSEELIHLAEATAAHVEFVPQENEILTKIGNVGALLRYKS